MADPARSSRAWSVLRGEVRDIIREPAAVADPYWTNGLLLVLANAVIDEYWMILGEQFEGWTGDTATLDTVAGQSEYALPDGLGRIKRVVFRFVDGNRTLDIPLSHAERWGDSVASSTDALASDRNVPAYRVLGNNLILEPAPQESSTGRIRLEQDSLPARLSADGDTVDIRLPAEFESLLVYETAVKALQVEGSQDNTEGGYLMGISQIRDSYKAAFFDFTAVRTFGRVFGQSVNRGD